MKYVIDTSSWQQLFGCYRKERFPILWALYNELVADGAITSIQQVLREIENRNKHNGELEWAQEHMGLFPSIGETESQFLQEIYDVPRFRHVVPAYLRDDSEDEDEYADWVARADPYLIARAKIIEGMVITQERERGNRVRIPTICGHFDIECGTLDNLMEKEDWSF